MANYTKKTVVKWHHLGESARNTPKWIGNFMGKDINFYWIVIKATLATSNKSEIEGLIGIVADYVYEDSNHCFPAHICGNVHGKNFRKQILSIILSFRCYCCWRYGVNASKEIPIISIFGDYPNTVINKKGMTLNI